MYALLTKMMNAMGVLTFFRLSNRSNLSILMYHGIRGDENKNHLTEYAHMNVPVSRFREQMIYLKNKYQILPLSEAVHYIENKQTLPRQSLVITFDDGYLNNYSLAYPVCKKLGIPFTIYVATDFINNQDLLWTDRLMLSIANTKEVQLEIQLNDTLLTFNLSTDYNKDQAHLCLLQHLKSMNAIKMIDVLKLIENQLGVNLPETDTSSLRPCSWKNLKEMADSGLVEIGAHTAGHRILTRLSEEECKHELQVSKKHIEMNLNRPCNHFAYPNGKQSDFNKNTNYWIREAGYQSSVTTIEGFNNEKSDPFELNRFGIYGQYSKSDFISMISGFHNTLIQILRRDQA